MKRLLLTLTLIILVLCSCGNSVLPDTLTCDEILNTALQSQSDVPESEAVYRVSDGTLDEYTLSLWSKGVFEECEEFSIIEDCAMYVCPGTETFEIDVLKAKDDESVERLEKLLTARIETVSGGDKSAYDANFNKMIDSSIVYTDGKFAILLIAYDSQEAKTAIDKLK